MKENNYNILLEKLDEFIRKFYFNRIIRGSILFLSLAFALFLTVTLAEYFGNFSSSIRTGIFYGFATLLTIVFAALIAIPALKILAIGKRISHTQASEIIGKHFGEIDDKLFNVLQLNEVKGKGSSDLIEASINQKISELKPIPFTTAINFGENKRYIKYLVVPTLIIIGLAAFEPKIIKDGASRIVSHSEEFIPKAPYSISIENKTLNAFKNEDLNLKISIKGDEIPSQLSIIYNEQRFLLTKNVSNAFSYSFKNLQKNIAFRFFDGQFESKAYDIKVLPKPQLVDFTIDINYPTYLNKKPEQIKNTGDLTIPEGSQVKWTFMTADTEELYFILEDSSVSLTKSGENEFLFSGRYFRGEKYGLSTSNQFLKGGDTVFYNLEVIPDLYPSVEVDTKDDSLSNKLRYFKGFVKDDYGFARLAFHTQFIGANDSIGKRNTELIPINKSLNQAEFFHVWNTNSFALKAGDQIEYYFEVWDNDGVNGSKSARTKKISFKAPTKDEIKDQNKESNKLVKDELKESIQLTKEIRDDLEQLKEKMLTKKQLGFQEKKQLKSLLEKQKKVQQSLDKLKKNNQKNNQLQEEFNPMDEQLLEKQKKLEEMFENIMTEEMKEMMNEIEKMMEKMNKEDVQKSLEKIALSNEDLEKELDRNLELFKQLELEKQLGEAKEKLDEIKKEEEALKEKSNDKKTNAKELKKEQDELNKKFEELTEELDEIEKKNEELESPNKMEDTKSLEEQIKEDMKESSEELSKQNKKEASEKQDDTKEKMEELSEKLNEMQMQMQSEANAENLEDLRQLLENLIELSFDQEDVMEQLRVTDRNDPKYVSLAQRQRKLQDDSQIIEDSLFALSKRIIQLEQSINKEMTAINFNMKKALEELGERKTPTANSRQQLAMTSINNLALMLDEAVQNMQMQMQMQQGKGECKKPGGSKPKAGGMKKMQQQLNKQMQDLKKAMEKGQKPGGKKGGKPGQDGKPGMSKELAQMAAKQSAIRKAVEQLQEQIGEGEGSSNGKGELKKLGELMEQTETDLVNKQITNQTLLRQQEILTRLLQSEKAEREREQDEKRESTEFTDEISRNPNEFFEYNRLKEKEIELLRTLPPTFNNFYKTKVSEYFYQIEK